MKAKFRRTLLAATLALAAMPVAQAADSPFTQTIFFGDSLTDGGYFRPVLIQMVGPNGALIGQFTNNPGYVWAQYLADYYGSNAQAAWTGNATANPTLAGGNNWAVGGARVGTNVAGGLGYTPSLTSQYARYLSAGNSVDPNALYSIWGGGNDLLLASGTFQAAMLGGATQAQAMAQAQPIIAGAVAAEIGLIGALKSAGAQYVLVASAPDLGLTPASRAGGTAGMALGTSLASSFNTALFSGLASSGISVIPLDTFHFLQEVVANPGAYGISNVTGKACATQPAPAGGSSLFCSPASTVPGGASYLFADDIHPTQAAHRALADYAISVIEGPRQLAILPHSEVMVGRARAQMVEGAIAGLGKEEGMRWWADVRGDQQRYGAPFHYDGIGPAASFGIGWTSGNVVYGAFAGYGRQDNDFGQRRGEFSQTDAGLGGFVGWRSGSFWANGQLGWTKVSFEVDRAVHLGPATRVHSGSPDGDNLSLGATAGFNFGDDHFSHGPVVGLLSQKISIDGYAESDPTLSTSLAYPQQDFDSLIGSVGWQASFAINEHLRPYAKLTWDREFEDAPAQAYAQAQSIPGSLPYAVPGLQFDDNYGTLTYGVRSELFGLDVTTGSSLTVGQKGGDDATFFVRLSSGF